MIQKLLTFDFDGTLSCIVADRQAAVLQPACRKMLGLLGDMPDTCTAVLSSRTLEDLTSRIDVPGVALGGGNGAQWLLSDGRRLDLAGDQAGRLAAVRAEVFSELQLARSIDGFDIEDKTISLAVHTRNVAPRYRNFIQHLMNFMKTSLRSDIAVYRGHEAFEIVLLPELRKTAGLSALCRCMDFDLQHGWMLYAGDDAQDGEVMKFVIQNGGTAFTVGPVPLVPGATAVPDPPALAAEILRLTGSAADPQRKGS